MEPWRFHPDNAPYHRLAATYSVSSIPPAWLAQLQLGLTGCLVVASDGAAHGHLLGDTANFMSTRTQAGTETVTAVAG